MIAAAGHKGALQPALAWPLLAAIVAGTLGVGLGVSDVTQIDPARVPKPGEVLAERARADPVAHRARRGSTRQRILVRARTSASCIARVRNTSISQNSMHVVIERDPPNDVPGMATVVLDPTGKLIRFNAIPER